MGIKGLTDNVKVAFPSIGTLRKGGPKGEKGIGPDLDYFRFTSDDPKTVEDFAELYGARPQSLRVFLPYAKASANFEAWKEAWTASGLAHRCDGETCIRWRDKDGLFHDTPIPCPGGCSPIGRLSVILPEMFSKGHVGPATLQTHGKHDLMSITASLLQAEELMRDNPLGLKGIEWKLFRVKTLVSTPAKDRGRVRMNKWLVKIVPATEWVKLQLEIAEAGQMRTLLPAAFEPEDQSENGVDPLTGEILVDEENDETEVIEEPEKMVTVEVIDLRPDKPQGPPLQEVKNGKVLNEDEAIRIQIMNGIKAKGLKGETVRSIVGMITNKEQAVDEVKSSKQLQAILREIETS